MANQTSNSVNPKVDLAYRRKKNAEEMKHQVISFVLMIFLTIIAFVAVGADMSPLFIVPVIILLAVIQCIFQLYYFMHMNHKGHEVPALFLYSGLTVALVTILAFVTIIWW
ncbi:MULTISPECIES: cytochrome c oxidase subunit IVB [Sutcliffiella]|uniref:Cytochrome c oxidase subunit IVB n=1 Tax=Sutcliffiella cohnii TaxID=33932 RepID=A0A223KS54_9BACI|nr:MULTISPECIES: cytochrome c oxidase subunit IVB [Sutcliffiella]AST92184.1 cytochrome c oxidase subunit IVB [Sutcliffiella cohnii]WBL13416.1 cytochrome c oxidase subunit IVB [Sutcliffiella sp. NC1]